MYVTLMFDVEDLVDPRSDDTTLRLIEIFTEASTPCTFMVVGEKARLWEQRGRRDLFHALLAHDVGLHTDRHSIHPTVAEYLEGKGWDDGIREAVVRELPGVTSHLRLFGRMPSCWGIAGSTWGPQVAPALRQMRVPATVYTYTHPDDKRRNLHRFCDNVGYHRYIGGFDHVFADDAQFTPAWESTLAEVADLAAAGTDWVGLFVSHPAMVRAKLFWDFLNFNHGINTPVAEWRMPEYRDEAEWQVAQANLRRIALDVQRLPGIQVRTVRDVNGLLAAPPQAVPAADLVQRAAAAPQAGLTTDDVLLSPAERLYHWALWLDSGTPEGGVPHRYVEGPVEEPPALTAPATVGQADVRAAAGQLRRAVEQQGRLPARVRLGAGDVGVGTLYRALAAVCAGQRGDVTLQPGPEVPPVGDLLAREVREGIPGWMHKPDLDVTTHAAYTRLQSWTIKAAPLR
jgi:hypothetical protein